MVRKTREAALETRNALLDTAELVFSEKGVSATPLADIASAAGVTRGAIYWHFKNKADLFDAMCDRVRLPLEEITAASAEDEVADPLAALLGNLEYLYHKVTTDEHFYRVFDVLFNKCEFVDSLGPIVERDTRVREQFRLRIQRIFSNAVQRGLLPADTDVALVVNAYMAYSKGILRNWLLEPGAFDLHRDGTRMVAAFMESLRTSDAFRQLG